MNQSFENNVIALAIACNEFYNLMVRNTTKSKLTSFDIKSKLTSFDWVSSYDWVSDSAGKLLPLCRLCLRPIWRLLRFLFSDLREVYKIFFMTNTHSLE
jgi:hypothetical protein